jgi:hypothetical protein
VLKHDETDMFFLRTMRAFSMLVSRPVLSMRAEALSIYLHLSIYPSIHASMRATLFFPFNQNLAA